MEIIVKWSMGIGALEGWRRALLAFFLGALLTLSLAPAFVLVMLPLSLVPFLWIMRGVKSIRSAFFVGWMFGAGFLWAGLYWISFSMLVDAARFAWAIPLGSLALPLAIALITGAGTAAMWLLKGPRPISPLLFAVVMTVFEWIRGQILTGLPWNLAGYSFAATDGLLQSAALVGAYGLTLIALFVGAAAADLGQRNLSLGRRSVPLFAAILLILGLQVWGELRLQASPVDMMDGPFVRLLQPNIPQAEKWAPEFRARNLAIYRDLAKTPSAKPITHLILPEVALPYLLPNDPEAAKVVGQLVSEEAFVISGTIRREASEGGVQLAYNSVAVISGSGVVLAIYDKMHLVPFGEYLPLRTLLAPFGLDKMVFGPSDYSSGLGPLTLDVPGLPPARVLICYEGVFPDEILLEPATSLLINVTNDAWFGETAGPWQHFETERMRAVEQGVPMLRAANTGVSAVIDAHGRVLAELTLGTSGVIDSAVPIALTNQTHYRKFGDVPLLLFLGFFLLWHLLIMVVGKARTHESP